MKCLVANGERGITRLEVIILIVVFAGFGFLVVSALSGAKDMANGIACVNNLKYVGLGLRTFNTDNGGRFPMEVSVADGGTREWMKDETQLWRHWRRITNELGSPKVLLCPSDRRRQPSFFGPQSLTWGDFTDNSHLSYFLGLGASQVDSVSIISGDRNLMTNGVAAGPGRLLLSTNMVLGFSESEIHKGYGQLLRGDGGVDQLNAKTLDPAWFAAQTNSNVTKVWLIP